MSWLELSFVATGEAVDWVRTTLATIDPALAITVTPAQDALVVRCGLPNNGQGQRCLDQITQRLSGLERTQMITPPVVTPVATFPAPGSMGGAGGWQRLGRFWIADAAGSGSTSPPTLSAGELAIALPASLSFGSGFHPTTQLCLQLLLDCLPPDLDPRHRVLDLGCGSGILSIAAAKLGSSVLALDNDPLAVQATQTAIEQNQVSHRVSVHRGSLGAGEKLGHWLGGDLAPEHLNSTLEAAQPNASCLRQFNCIVANLPGRIQIALAADYAQSLGAGGILLTSGYTQDYELDLQAACSEQGLKLVARLQAQAWLALGFRLERPVPLSI